MRVSRSRASAHGRSDQAQDPDDRNDRALFHPPRPQHQKIEVENTRLRRLATALSVEIGALQQALRRDGPPRARTSRTRAARHRRFPRSVT
jgi:hypothetical protein